MRWLSPQTGFSLSGAGVAEGRCRHATPASQETHTHDDAQQLGTLLTAAINKCNHHAQCEEDAMGIREDRNGKSLNSAVAYYRITVAVIEPSYALSDSESLLTRSEGSSESVNTHR